MRSNWGERKVRRHPSKLMPRLRVHHANGCRSGRLRKARSRLRKSVPPSPVSSCHPTQTSLHVPSLALILKLHQPPPQPDLLKPQRNLSLLPRLRTTPHRRRSRRSRRSRAAGSRLTQHPLYDLSLDLLRGRLFFIVAVEGDLQVLISGLACLIRGNYGSAYDLPRRWRWWSSGVASLRRVCAGSCRACGSCGNFPFLVGVCLPEECLGWWW